MKRYGGLWEKVICWENLRLAALKARRGKRDRPGVQRFEFNLESNLLALRAELADGTYRPGPFSTHWIVRAKARLISAAPCRDRVQQHVQESWSVRRIHLGPQPFLATIASRKASLPDVAF